jgi:hypothetical protein
VETGWLSFWVLVLVPSSSYWHEVWAVIFSQQVQDRVRTNHEIFSFWKASLTLPPVCLRKGRVQRNKQVSCCQLLISHRVPVELWTLNARPQTPQNSWFRGQREKDKLSTKHWGMYWIFDCRVKKLSTAKNANIQWNFTETDTRE